MYYTIRVQRHLDPSWQDRLGGLCIEQQETGTTLLSGTLPDQAALHGVLLQIIRLGLTLLSLETSEAPNETGGMISDRSKGNTEAFLVAWAQAANGPPASFGKPVTFLRNGSLEGCHEENTTGD